MLIQPQEANLVTYNVGLCRMVNGNLEAPYEGGMLSVMYITVRGDSDLITRMFWEGEKRAAREPTDNIHKMPL